MVAAAPACLRGPGRLGPGLPWWLPASTASTSPQERGLAAPLCGEGGQLPRSAHGSEACDGEPSATEGALSLAYNLCRCALCRVQILLVSYRR